MWFHPLWYQEEYGSVIPGSMSPQLGHGFFITPRRTVFCVVPPFNTKKSMGQLYQGPCRLNLGMVFSLRRGGQFFVWFHPLIPRRVWVSCTGVHVPSTLIPAKK